MKWTWDKFGIHIDRPAPDPVAMDRIPRAILNSLHLNGLPGIRVQFYETIGKAVVIVPAKVVNPTWQEIHEASRKSGWDVEVFAAAKFDRLKRLALNDFNTIESISPELAQALVDHGYFTLDDLSIIKPEVLMRVGKLDAQQADAIIRQAEIQSEQMEI